MNLHTHVPAYNDPAHLRTYVHAYVCKCTLVPTYLRTRVHTYLLSYVIMCAMNLRTHVLAYLRT